MRKTVFFCSILLLVSIAAPNARAEETSGKQPATAAPAQPVHYYRLDFVIENLDAAGKVTNSRSYSTMVDTGLHPHEPNSIRTGSRVPIVTGAVAGNTQYVYVDLGVNFDVREVNELDEQLAFELTASLSGEASPSQPGQDLNHPVIRQNKWASRVLVPLGKRTVVFTSDSLDNKGSTRVVVTATRIED